MNLVRPKSDVRHLCFVLILVSSIVIIENEVKDSFEMSKLL